MNITDIEIVMMQAFRDMISCKEIAETSRDKWFKGRDETKEIGREQIYWAGHAIAKDLVSDNQWYMQQAIMYANIVSACESLINALSITQDQLIDR